MASPDIITIYTDGGADPNPGVGGWGAVIIRAGAIEDLSGGAPETTNNRMEMMAAIRALESLAGPSRVKLFTDSQYLKNGITKWLPAWVRRNWQRKDGELKNVDLWQTLAKLVEVHDIEWSWVRGHSGNQHNERADTLATAAIQRQKRGQRADARAVESAGAARSETAAATQLPLLEAHRTEPSTGATTATTPEYRAYQRVRCVDGRGSWAIVIRRGADRATLCGAQSRATANRLEVYAAVIALASLPESVNVDLHTSSDYLRMGAMQWLSDWKRRDWRTAAGQAVKNVDIWRRLDTMMQMRTITWQEPGDVPAEVDAELERLLSSVERNTDTVAN